MASIKVTPAAPTMSEQERADAMAWLTDPDLLDHLSADLAALVSSVSRQTSWSPTWPHLPAVRATLRRLVQSSSAAGKSTLSDAVARWCRAKTWCRSRPLPPRPSTTWRWDLAHSVGRGREQGDPERPMPQALGQRRSTPLRRRQGQSSGRLSTPVMRSRADCLGHDPTRPTSTLSWRTDCRARVDEDATQTQPLSMPSGDP